MSDNFSNEFSWSSSRQDLFEQCKRKYFLQYYGSWKGWEEEAADRTRTIYRLKQLDNRHLWKGNTVHDAIAFLLKTRLQNCKIDPKAFKKAVVRRLRNQFRESRSGDFKNDPKNKFGLLEHEYQKEVGSKVWQSNRDDILKCIENFQSSEFWELASSLKFSDCLALEGDLQNPRNIWEHVSADESAFINLPYEPAADNFWLDDLKVWVKLDFAYRENDSLRIVDWKSGESDDKPDPMQLNVYGYYAVEVWNFPEKKINLTVYNVAREKRYDRQYGPEQKKETRRQILENVEKMKSTLTDREQNQSREEDFFKIEDKKICRHCRYRCVCKPKIED